jgi:multiple antibiotic resistance protein
MVTDPIGISVVVDAFILLLIGVGPKIALVPFLELTAGMDDATKARVTRKMIVTACTIALLLVALGEFLARLLHFSQGALSIAGGVVLLIIAVSMILGTEDREADSVAGRDPLHVAVFPLAVPYLLNPVGIVVLVTLSGNADSLGLFALVVALLAVVVVLDVLVFRWANRVADHLDQSRMLVTEKVFGFLLAALAVQLVLDGLDLAGVIELTSH